jgi:hypothetical protein
VLPAGSELIEDVRKAPEDVLSMREPMVEVRLRANGELILIGII